MTTAHISDRDERLYILLRQQKTSELLAIPLHTDLAPLVRDRMATRIIRQRIGTNGQAQEVESMLLVPSPNSLPWAYRNFARAWDAQRKVAGIEGKQRRDLRRTAVVRLAEAAATVPQIASVTGWSIDYCQASWTFICRGGPQSRSPRLNCGIRRHRWSRKWSASDWPSYGEQQGYANRYANCQPHVR